MFLSFSGLFVTFFELALALVLPPNSLTAVLAWIAIASFACLAMASALLSDRALLWELPLQTIAIALGGVGACTLTSLAFRDWHLLIGRLAFTALASLLAGVCVVLLTRHLQSRWRPQQDA